MKSSLYGYLLKKVEKKLNGEEKNIKKQDKYTIIMITLVSLIAIFLLLFLMYILYVASVKLTVKSRQIFICILVLMGVGWVVSGLALIFFVYNKKGFSYIDPDKERDKLFESMISDKTLFHRLNQILAESDDKNLAMNILISDSKYEHKKAKYKHILYIFLNTVFGSSAMPFFISLISKILNLKWMVSNLPTFIVSLAFIISIEKIIYEVYKYFYKKFYINILDLKKGTLEVYIKDYVTGYITCQWDISEDGDDVVLNIHAIQLYPGQLASNIHNSDKISKIVIDPGVIAPRDSSSLFSGFPGVKEFVGLSNLDTSQVTDMHEMFASCGAKELDLSGWDTSQVTDMGSMFLKCLNLEKVNVKGWDTTKVNDMSSMFFGCQKLHKLDLSNFKTPNLKMGEMMFGNDSIYDLDIRNLESSKTGTRMLFDDSLIYKMIVGSKFKDTFPDNDTFHDYDAINRPFEEDRIMYIPTSNKWVALDGPDKGSKKDPYEMKNVTRTQPVTYEVEHMPLEN